MSRMMKQFLSGIPVVVLAAVAASVGDTAAVLLGPVPYRSFADSPFQGANLHGFQNETFEDHMFNLPGVSASAGVITSIRFPGENNLDSVDGDDGDPTDGVCTGCDSLWTFPAIIRLTFAPDSNGHMPTHAGVVWTDGDGTTSFEAFDEAGQSLGALGPYALADGTFNNTTEEDRFFAAIHGGGISAIDISNTAGGIEIDHIQFGWSVEACMDADGDGYGPTGDPACPGGTQPDCDDTDSAIHPGAADLPGDSIDDNCDGATVCDPDDGWGSRQEYVQCVHLECKSLARSGAVSRFQCNRIVRDSRLNYQ